MTDSLDQAIFGADQRSETRASRRDKKGRRRRRGSGPRRIGAALLALAVVVGVVWGAVALARPAISSALGIFAQDDVDYPGPGEGAVVIEIKKGQTGEDIATTLKGAGVVKTRTAYLDAAKADPAAAAKVRPGSYSMLKGMTGAAAFAFISNPTNAVAAGVTIPEGLWASEIYQRLSDKTGVPVSEYETAAKIPASIGLPEQAAGNVEGWLFPSTYEFDDNATAAEQLSVLVAKTSDELMKAGVELDQAERILTVASIVEAEAGQADQAKVARVIENRLANPTGPTVGFLQMDSTRNYALTKRGNLTAADAAAASASQYDTYTHKGLPPGPIGNPGAAAITAAAHPAEGDWFYFVTVNFDTGETIFSATAAEHDANVAQLRAWCAANKPKCESK